MAEIYNETLEVTPSSGIAELEINPAPFVLVEGETYRVVWDGVEYELICENQDGGMALAYYVLDENGESTDGSFMVVYASPELTETEGGGVYIMCLGSATSHTLAIYQDAEEDTGDSGDTDDTTEEETQEGIILKDRKGNDVAYYGIETATFDTTTEGKQQVYSKGVAVEGLEITPDFSVGDMPLSAGEDKLVKSATIIKPGDLSSENVRKGKTIAGIEGSFIGDTEELIIGEGDGETPLNFAEVEEMVFTPSVEDKVFSQVTVKKPENLLPENIAKDVEIGGVVGEFEGGSGLMIKGYETSMAAMFAGASSFNYAVTIPNDITNMAKAFYNCVSFNQPLIIPDSVTDMSYTFYNCANLNQPISIGAGVVNMANAFHYCNNFNQPVTIPDGVTNMSAVFWYCNNFNQPITIPAGVTSTYGTLTYCNSFNQPVTISDGVTNTAQLFASAPNFNQPVNIPNSVTNTAMMFRSCKNFNQPVTISDGVVNAAYMFESCYNLNQPITIPNSVTSVHYTFAYCYNMGQPITIGTGVTSLTNTFRSSTNITSDITILSNNVNYTRWMLYGKNNSSRVNIHCYADTTTNKYLNNHQYGMMNAAFTWTYDNANNCRYNTTYNIYVYWDL